MKTLSTTLLLLMTCLLTSILFSQASAQTETEPSQEAETELRQPPDASVLEADQWKKVDASVERALTWLASQQQADGSFRSIDVGQPAITSLCLMAFLAQGESPVDGQYQQQLTKAIGYILAQQKANGLIGFTAPDAVPIPRDVPHKTVGSTSVYNHAISGLALTQAYGQCDPEQAKRIATVIEQAIAATLEMQRWDGKRDLDVGGWRYLNIHPQGPLDSDLSVTGWQLMFLRSAKNAGFDVPKESVDAAIQYVENCFVEEDDRQVHSYYAKHPIPCTRAMAGAGVLALAHAGKHDSKEAIASGEWILKHDFKDYNVDTPVYGAKWSPDRYHYGGILCSQAMFQLGGKYWEQFFPPFVTTLLANQQADGAWPPERNEKLFGSCYSTSLCVLSLSVPNQILPIFQR